MNKLKTTELGGFPLVLDDLRFLQNTNRLAWADLLKSIFTQTTSPSTPFNSVMLWGGEVTEHTTYVEITEGAFFFKDEIYHIFPHSVPLSGVTIDDILLYVIEEDDPVGAKLFLDGVTHNTYKVRKAVLSRSPVVNAITSIWLSSIKRMPSVFNVVPSMDEIAFHPDYTTLALSHVKVYRHFNQSRFSIHLENPADLLATGNTPIKIASIPSKYRPQEPVTVTGYCMYNGTPNTSYSQNEIIDQSMVFTLKPNGDLIAHMWFIPSAIVGSIDVIVNSPNYYSAI